MHFLWGKLKYLCFRPNPRSIGQLIEQIVLVFKTFSPQQCFEIVESIMNRMQYAFINEGRNYGMLQLSSSITVSLVSVTFQPSLSSVFCTLLNLVKHTIYAKERKIGISKTLNSNDCISYGVNCS